MGYWTRFRTAEGWPIHAATTHTGLCRLDIGASVEAFLARLPVEEWREDGSHPALAGVRQQLAEYFRGARRAFDLPLDLRGTPFQQRVWEQLLRIPFGETRSYADLARSTGSVARAVGQANGSNPVAIVVPCHRVINGNGGLGGYAGGLERKRLLLDLESGAQTLLTSAP